VELLETRTLLSVANLGGLTAHPFVNLQPMSYNGTVTGYTPSVVHHAYSTGDIFFNTPGGRVRGDGRGQTVAIVDAYDDPFILSDLRFFSHTFDLPGITDTSFQKFDQRGNRITNRRDVTPDPYWSEEISLDVETVHAIAPRANIDLVEADSNLISDVFTAVQAAANLPGVSVVSMSFGIEEAFFGNPTGYDSIFTTPMGHTPVSFVASSGDDGGFFGPNYPASSPNVLGVGGTTLYVYPNTNRYAFEAAWFGSGGGTSFYESQPSYQNGVQSSGFRDVPDVAFDADPNTGPAMYDTFAIPSFFGTNQSGWFQIGGTSFGAPAWSGLLAIANQGRALNGLSALGNAAAAVYSLPSGDFRDIFAGQNYYSKATVGYDLVTGLGTPRANHLIPDLASLNVPGSNQGAPVNLGQLPRVTVNPMSHEAPAVLVSANGLTGTAQAAPAVLSTSLAVASPLPAAQALPSSGAHLSTATAVVSGQADPTPERPVLAGDVRLEQPGSTLVPSANVDTGAAAPADLNLLPQAAEVGTESSDAVFAADLSPVPVTDAAPAALTGGDAARAADPAFMAGLAALLGSYWTANATAEPEARQRQRPRF
jgi:hypothetical protein